MRRIEPLLLVLMLAACGHAPVRHAAPATASGATSVPALPAPSAPSHEPRASAPTGPDPCAPTRVHDERDYTPGGLYAPGVADTAPAAPIDVSRLAEPVPRDEPRSRYGNRSPYTVLGRSYRVMDDARGYRERGVASWYGTKFNGRATSSGEIYDICSFTAAHKTLPLPSYVRVTNLDNGRSVIVRVNDRGPFHEGRLIDLSYAAAVRLGVDRTGTARVELQAVGGEGDTLASADPAPVAPAAVGPTEPAAAAAPSAPVSGSVPSDGEGRKIVQVGSFAEKDNARRLANRLDAIGIDDVDLDHAEVSGRDVWRVRIGPVAADRLAALFEKIRSLGLPSPHVSSE